MLDKDQAPYYIQIAQQIREKIIKGQYTVDAKVPSEEEIVKSYGVSRMTARHAITQLVNEGYVYRVHGKGAFVARSKVERSLNSLKGFYEDMSFQGLNPSSKIIEFHKRLPSHKEQHTLKIKKNQPVYYLSRIRYIDAIPIGVQNLIVPVHLVPDFEKIDLEKTSFYSYLNDIGSPLVKAHQRMEAVLAPEMAEQLGISNQIPFYYLERISIIKEETPVELLVSYFRGDMYSYNITLT